MKFITIITLSVLNALTLQDAFNSSEPFAEYDKYLILEPNTVYYRGIGLFEGNIFIDCQGSVIDLQSENGIWVYGDSNYPCNLDMQYCSIINGEYFGLSFGGEATGYLKNINLINNDIGLKLMDFTQVEIVNSNIIDNRTYGLAIITENPICTISYCNSWNNGEYDFMENCPG